MENSQRDVARVESVEITCEDHPLTLIVTFTYDGGGQGLIGPVDADFIQRFMRAMYVTTLDRAVGSTAT